MKSLTFLVQEVLNEMGTWCRISTSQDCKTILARVEDEGLSFLTITLPTLGADLQKGLDSGKVDSQLFQGFKRGKGSLPLFLGGFFGLVFDRTSGLLLDNPSIDAIFAIRQITLFCSKVAMKTSLRRNRKAIDKFVECEKQVRETDSSLTTVEKQKFLRLSNLLWSEIFQTVDETVYNGEIIPKHGPGSTAEKLLGNKKFQQSEWTQRLDKVFPSEEYLYPNLRSFINDPDRVELLEPGAERPVRVITVPKTLKTPRIIAIEPTCMQYTQQGILEVLVKAIQQHDTANTLIGFTDQTPNQRMAQKGSSDGSLATLDLSEASDRVSNQLVRLMLTNFPHLAEGIDACRSRKADVPGHGVLRLAKFASMGSALCFPIEALVFTTLIFYGIEQELNRPLGRKDIKILSSQVRVYGDDIIVPVNYVQCVVDALETFGFRVNASKSFWTGKFRESCGKEYYDGFDVSIVKLRRDLPTQRKHVQEIISTVSLRNQMYFAGMWKTCGELDQLLRRIIPLPTVGPSSPVLGRHSFLGFAPEKECPRLHKPLVKGFMVRNITPVSIIQDDAALLKVFLKRGVDPNPDAEHLRRAGRPDTVDIKIGWGSAA